MQPFTPGNIVVERLGTGTSSLNTSNNSIFFDEYASTGAGQTPVQSVPIPSTGPAAMVEGNSTAEGEMTLAGSGLFICFPGGVTNTSNPFSLGSATSAQVPRGVGTVDGNGTYSQAINSSVAYNAGTMRGVVSDGAGNFWASGTATGLGGIFYLGTNNASNDIYSANLRCSGIFNGNLYYSTGSGTPGIGIWEFSGTPALTNAAGNTATHVITTTGSPYNFSVSPDGNTIFFTDDQLTSTAPGIHKWVNSGGSFSEAYVLVTNPCYGILVDWTTSPATVYATTTNGPNNSIIKVSDTGAGAAIVTNATAGQNKMFRNLSFAPTNSTFVAMPPSITGINPTSVTAASGGTVTFTLSGFTGNPIASNNWYEVSGAITNLISHSKGTLTLSNLVSGNYSIFCILTNASGSAPSSVASLTVTPNPVISAISPSLVITNPGANVTFTLTANPGNPAASDSWYKISGGVTNLLSDGPTGAGSTISGSATTNLTISTVAFSDAAGYFAILTNPSGSATSAVATLMVSNIPPVITGQTVSVTDNAGQTVSFGVTNSGTAPFIYFWYAETGTSTNLISVGTNSTLTLANITAGDAPFYQVAVSNITTVNATSAVMSLIVTNDPNIEVQPASTHGLLDGTVQFSVVTAGAGLTYQWYFADANSNVVAAITDGGQATGSTISGSISSTLTIANLQLSDPTNVYVVVSGIYGGPIQSTVVSLLDVSLQANLAFWDFNGQGFTNTLMNPNSIFNPVPYIGSGTAQAVGNCFFPGTSPFSGAVDPNDGLGFTQHLPPFSWGTSHYPVSGGNKQNGVQFNVSTVGAKNIKISYESRVSATASDYERLQYTTNGTDWTDYPANSSFNGIGVTYLPFSYDLSGFPGVANNPNFGFRVVTEWQSSATYGISLSTNASSTNFLGTANSYISGESGGFAAGTVTYDLVTVQGDAITNANVPPEITAGITDTNLADFTNITVDFTVAAGTTPADSLIYNAVSLNSSKVNPTFTFGGSGANRTLKIVPNDPIPDQVDAAPILVTATDAAGDVAATWFLLTVTSSNLPPTNSLTRSPGATNTLANTPITIPFGVGDDHTPASGLTYSAASDNNTLVPVGNIVFGNTSATNPTVTITPAQNQLGTALLTITVNDNDQIEPRSTPANLILSVRPNTNVETIDYFTYDNAGGSLDQVSAGFWTHLSGNFGQMKVGSGVVTIDTLDFTENLQAPLIGAPYKTNNPPVTPTTLFASYTVDMDTVHMPLANGSYFTAFNDGTINTVNVEGCVVAATNGAAPGFYRLGIANRVGANATNSQMFPMDLTPGSNYVVVQELDVTNGFSTLWVAPTSPLSPSVMDTTPPATATNLYNIKQFTLRESGGTAGIVYFGKLKVGTTFDSVFPSLTVQASGSDAIVNWSDPTLPIQSTTNLTSPFTDLPGATPPYTNSVTGTNADFFRFKP